MDSVETRLRYSAENCSIKGTLEIVGERWSLLVLREAFFGLRRFGDFHQVLGCARNLLSERLAKLVDHGVLERVAYQDPGQRGRYEYQLTEKGLELLPALVALMQWGDRWTTGPDGPPVQVRHRDCGGAVSAILACEHGHHALTPHATRATPGPGAQTIAPTSASVCDL
ncbi:helix-turn-helix domain-containing protein [Nonomuraea sp. NPDC052129]|uniref:winged helix-turn-helix transcriptional regulator n=1 Tax=Nonomuraea sp. NPDC052129 TaxID=3154651 RepID=UPI0034413608